MPDHSRTAFLIVVLMTATALAGPSSGKVAASSPAPTTLLPLERQVRDQFPSVALDSQATLESAQELVAGRMISHSCKASRRRVFLRHVEESFFRALPGGHCQQCHPQQ